MAKVLPLCVCPSVFAPLPMLDCHRHAKTRNIQTLPNWELLTHYSTEVDIPTKNHYSNKQVSSRPLGFAFVQFETKEDADKVIEEFNGKDFKGRKVYVKKAVPPPTEEEKQKKLEEYRAKTQAAKEKKKALAAEAKAKEEVSGEKSTKSQKDEGGADSATAPTTRQKKAKRTPKPKVPLEEGTKSTDTIFITNLAFDVNVKTLTDIFEDYKPVWIHVPVKKVPYKILQKQKESGKPPRNKGIAFVKFTDESLQKKAIEEFNGKEINDRVIVVDVAIDARVHDGEEKKTESSESSAPSTALANVEASEPSVTAEETTKEEEASTPEA